jgi:hypothetical protein
MLEAYVYSWQCVQIWVVSGVFSSIRRELARLSVRPRGTRRMPCAIVVPRWFFNKSYLCEFDDQDNTRKCPFLLINRPLCRLICVHKPLLVTMVRYGRTDWQHKSVKQRNKWAVRMMATCNPVPTMKGRVENQNGRGLTLQHKITKPRRGAANVVTELSIFYDCFS